MISCRSQAFLAFALFAACAAGIDAAVPEDVSATLEAWGPTNAATAVIDRNGDGTVNMRDVVLALMGKRERPGESIIRTQQAGAGTTFIGIECEPVVEAGWADNGYADLDTYRVYAVFETGGDDRGVLTVFAVDEQPLVVTSSSGVMHNDAEYDSLTAPADLRDAGVWSNQWDTYVTINATQAEGDATWVSPFFGEATNNLSTSFSIENEGWFVTPLDDQRHVIDGRVLLGQFSVVAGAELDGSLNLLLLDGTTVLDAPFFCAGGGGGVDRGACCLDDGAECRTVTEAFCAVLGGVFRGIDTDCIRQIVDTPCHPGASGQHCVRILATCPEEGAARSGCEPGPLLDAWLSREDGSQSTFHDFGANGQAVPADFFAFGSDPLIDLVTFESVPIGGQFGDADTIIERSADPFDRCALPSEDEVSVAVELLALNLQSAFPVRVTYLSGQFEQFWDVGLSLSQLRPAQGTLRATKTTCNGGTYTVEDLRVQPQFTFTRVDNPEDVRVFDTGIRGIDPVVLSLEEGHWVSDVDPGVMVFSPYCTEFRPGVLDAAPPANCDCNGNELRDHCDIEAGESVDCNADAVPDECEIAEGAADCNKNGLLDWCECPGDIVSDCLVGFADLLAVIGTWGPCDGCAEDVTRDGLVGYADVLEILATWGPCGLK